MKETCLMVGLLGLFTIGLTILFVNSEKARFKDKCDLGKYISSQPISTSFNEMDKTFVHTTKGDFVISGYHSFINSQEVILSCSDVRK